MTPRCQHLDHVRTETANTPAGCEECLAPGSRWVQLRLCLSFERGDDWGYCYVEPLMIEPAPRPLAR